MKDRDIMHVLQVKKREAEEKRGYHISLMVLKGSQNYNCADENSDIDAVAFFVPTLEQLIDGKIVSKKLTMNDGAFIELKDIRLFTNLMAKANPSYLELLYSPYRIIDGNQSNEITALIISLFSMRDEISVMNLTGFYKTIKGTSYQRYKSFLKSLDNDQGYNRKSFYQIYRMYLLADLIIRKGISYEAAICPGDIDYRYQDFLMHYKNDIMCSEKAMAYASIYNEMTTKMIDVHLSKNDFEFNLNTYASLQLLINKIVEFSIRLEMMKTGTSVKRKEAEAM